MSQSLDRGLEILTRLGPEGHTLDDLAGQLDVHKTTVLRLLRTLEAQRFVRRDASHRYYLGARLFALASDALCQLEVRDRARPYLVRLSRTTGEQTVHLAALENDAVVYIDKVESTHAIRMYSRVGLIAPTHATAVGKVLIAAMPPGQREAIVAGLDLTAFTAATITAPEAMLQALDVVAAEGWAMDRGEHEDFINCIAAPIRDGTGRVVAAASVSVPDVVLDADHVRALLPPLLEATTAISQAAQVTGSPG